ncbi:unnamed protein product [Sphagnum troendelagicum]
MAAQLSPSSNIDDATSNSSSSSSSIGYMEHTASKLNTLSRVAIKYGVEYLASGSHSTSNNGIRYRYSEKKAPTSAMGLLRRYYGLASMTRAGSEGTEMDVYKIDFEFLYEDQPLCLM